MINYKIVDLFSGIGGFSYGLEKLPNFETIAFCEKDKDCIKVLNKHWPSVKVHDDIFNFSGSEFEGIENLVLTGGTPCQNISIAGDQKGIIHGAKSSLWSEYRRIISEARPSYAIIENVERLRKNGLGVVLNDLHRIGYDAEWAVIRADWVGYPHTRQRVFIISYPRSKRQHEYFRKRRHIQIDEEWAGSEAHEERFKCQPKFKQIRPILSRGAFDSIRSSYPCRKSFVSSVHRVTDGIPEAVHEKDRKIRIKQLGNSIIPRIATIIGEAINRFDSE